MVAMTPVTVSPEKFLDAADADFELFAITRPMMVVMVMVTVFMPAFPFCAKYDRPEKNSQRHRQNDAEHDQNVHPFGRHRSGGYG
jgi:hypothetical protein